MVKYFSRSALDSNFIGMDKVQDIIAGLQNKSFIIFCSADLKIKDERRFKS